MWDVQGCTHSRFCHIYSALCFQDGFYETRRSMASELNDGTIFRTQFEKSIIHKTNLPYKSTKRTEQERNR